MKGTEAPLPSTTCKGLARLSGSRYIMQMATLLGGMSLLGPLARNSTTLCFNHWPSSVNSGATVLVDQPNTGGGHVILSAPVKLNLRSGSNSITFGSTQSGELFSLKQGLIYRCCKIMQVIWTRSLCIRNRRGCI